MGENEESGLAIEAVIVIAVVGALLVFGLAIFLIWRYCFKRRKFPDRSGSTGSGGFEFKLSTLGKQYKLSSVLNINGDHRKLSSGTTASVESGISLRKVSSTGIIIERAGSCEEQEKLLDNDMFRLHKTKEYSEMRTNTFSKLNNEDPQYRPTTPSSINLSHEDVTDMGPKSPTSLMVDQEKSDEALRGSTYLDVYNQSAVSRTSSSHSSQDLSMEDIESRAKQEVMSAQKRKAPLATEESFHSLVTSAFSLGRPTSDGVNLGTQEVHLQEKRWANRPQSDGTLADEVAPSLPPKKRDHLQHKSTGNVTQANGPVARRILAKAKVTTSLSETCLMNKRSRLRRNKNPFDDDDDNDDFVDFEDLPPLPTKGKPYLPPKQRINKSREDLARIEHEMRSSASELKMKSVLFSDDSDAGEDYEEVPEVPNSSSKYSPDDYDEPLHHSVN